MTDRILHDIDGAGRWVDNDFATQADIADLVEGPVGDNWSMEIVSTSVNVASTGAHSGGSTNVTISGLAVGDFCFWMSTDFVTNRSFIFYTTAVCTTTDTIVLNHFNTDTGVIDPAAATHHFLVIHL